MAGVLDLAGQNVTATRLSGAAGTVTTSVAGPVTLTVNQNGVTNFGGSLQDGNGQLSLAFSGGRLVLSGVNAYSGGTTISGGILDINNPNSLGLANGGISIGPGTLEVSGDRRHRRQPQHRRDRPHCGDLGRSRAVVH